MRREDIDRIKSLWFSLHAETFGFDPSAMEKMTTREFPFQLANFIREWGGEDAEGIIRRFYDFPHEGRFNGEVLGEGIFQVKKYKVFQSQLCSEWHMMNG